MTESPPRAWAEIDRSALHHNLQLARRHSGKDVMAVIKGGAYGHGLIEIAKELDRQNLPFLGVANTGEARCLSKEGIKTRPYILGESFPRWLKCSISSKEQRQGVQPQAAISSRSD